MSFFSLSASHYEKAFHIFLFLYLSNVEVLKQIYIVKVNVKKFLNEIIKVRLKTFFRNRSISF